MDDSVTLRADATVQTDPDRPAGSAPVRKGTVVGRYVVLREVGRGGMGAVYAAYDPRLDRRVALKLLLDRGRRAEAIARLLREAQSLARLHHPNVVAVHDVGEFEDRVFVAMEFVEGRTLRRWQREEKHPWRDVLAVYRQAAVGLAAAHAAGVVHRDFKPENAMITDGPNAVVKVMDFGLARSGPPSVDASEDESVPEPTLTRAGTLLGTPAYMSPEQFHQATIGPASDQFSFCVALWEALLGERPFEGSTLHELGAHVAAGRIREPSDRNGVPRWLLQIVRRGLAPTPEQRHASMDALLHALDRGLQRRRGVLSAVGAASAVGLFLVGTLRPADDASCRRAAAEIREAWSSQRSDAIEAALVDTGHASARDVWQRARTDIDAFVTAWIDQHDHLCGAWRETLSEDLVALRRRCLLVQRSHLEGLLDAFAKPTPDTIGFASAAAAGLPGPQECAQIDDLDDAPPTDWVEEVTAAQRLAARAKAQRVAGDPAGAAEVYAQAIATLGGVPAPRARARILAAKADLLSFQGAVQEAERDLAEARRLAAESGDVDLLAGLWLDRVVQLNIHHPEQLDRQEHLLEAAELAVAQAGERPIHVARLHVARGIVAMDRGDFDRAQTQLEQGVAVAEATEVAPATVASYHDLLGHVHLQRGEYAKAREHMTRAVEIVVDSYGPAYPSARTFHGNVGGACLMQGDRACAREHFEAVQAMLDAANDEVSPARGHNLAQLAELEAGGGNVERARAHAEAALAVWRALGHERSLEAATTKLILHGLAMRDGAFEDALALAQDVDRIHREQRSPEHPEAVRGLAFVGDALFALQRHDEALAARQRVLEVREAALGPDHELVGIARGEKAEVLEAMGQHEAALVEARRAHEIFSNANSRPDLRGEGAFIHARLMWQAGDREGAIAMAREAIRAYDRATADTSESRHEAVAWLRERGQDASASAGPFD